MHSKEKEIIEGLLPSNIVIGPFWINTENVRQALSKKRKALGNAVLELLARKLRTQADDVGEVAPYSFDHLGALHMFLFAGMWRVQGHQPTTVWETQLHWGAVRDAGVDEVHSRHSQGASGTYWQSHEWLQPHWGVLLQPVYWWLQCKVSAGQGMGSWGTWADHWSLQVDGHWVATQDWAADGTDRGSTRGGWGALPQAADVWPGQLQWPPGQPGCESLDLLQ